MRIHPSAVRAKKFNWQIYITTISLVLLLTFNLPTVISPAPQPKIEAKKVEQKVFTKTVVLTKKSLPANTRIEKEFLVLEERPESTLSDDAIDSIDEIVGKVSVGPLPANYPLSRSLLTEPAPLIAKNPDAELTVRTSIQSSRQDTVSVAIPFGNIVPKVGQRIALNLKGHNGGSALIADEALVEDVRERTAFVRVDPRTALYLEDAKTLGKMSFLVISNFGESPYKSEVVSDYEQLQQKLSLKIHENSESAKQHDSETKSTDEVRSFAWSPDGDYYYGISKSGKIKEIKGTRIKNALRAFRLKATAPKKAASPLVPVSNSPAKAPERVRVYTLPTTIKQKAAKKPKEVATSEPLPEAKPQAPKVDLLPIAQKLSRPLPKQVTVELPITEVNYSKFEARKLEPVVLKVTTPSEAPVVKKQVEKKVVKKVDKKQVVRKKSFALPVAKRPIARDVFTPVADKVVNTKKVAIDSTFSKSGEISFTFSLKKSTLGTARVSPSSGHIKQTVSISTLKN